MSLDSSRGSGGGTVRLPGIPVSTSTKFSIVDGNRGTKMMEMSRISEYTLSIACAKKFVTLENKHIVNKLHYELSPSLLVRDVKDQCIIIKDGPSPVLENSTESLSVSWFQFLRSIKEISKEDLKRYSILFTVNELFPSTISALEEADLTLKLGINFNHASLILSLCKTSASSSS